MLDIDSTGWRNLPDEVIDRLVELHKTGMSNGEIAKELGICTTAVANAVEWYRTLCEYFPVRLKNKKDKKQETVSEFVPESSELDAEMAQLEEALCKL